jgi:hypothetical protein
MRVTTTTRAAAAIAGGLALYPGHAAAPRVPPHPPAHVRPAASQPASAPTLASVRYLDDNFAFRITQRGKYDVTIADAAEKWRHDAFVLKGLLRKESEFNPYAEHEESGARGISQFTPSGAAAVGRLQRARGLSSVFSYAKTLDPVASIHAAAEFLAYLRDACSLLGDGVAFMLAGYNTGRCEGRVPGFVLAVVKHANRYRLESGLPPLPAPEFWWRSKRRRGNGPQS